MRRTAIEDDDDRVPSIRGIFSERDAREASPPAARIDLWFAREADDGRIAVRLLDDRFTPTGQSEILSREEFLKRFTLEPELWYRLISQRLSMGDHYREANKFVEAQIEYSKVLAIDVDNIRANFGLGLAYLGLNEIKKATYVFERLGNLKDSFLAEHKHLYNEFGISLRKKKLFDLAVRHYARALALCEDDENLHLNIARAYFEMGDTPNTFRHLRRVLELEPGHEAALAFLDYLGRNNILPPDADAEAFFRSLPRRQRGEKS